MLKNQKFFSTNVGKLVSNNFKNSNISSIRSTNNFPNLILAGKLRNDSKFLKNLTNDNINFYYTGPNSGVINKYYGRNRRFGKKVDGHVGTLFDMNSLIKGSGKGSVQKISTKSKLIRSKAEQYFPVGNQFYGINKTVFTDGRSMISPQGFTLFSPKDMGFIQNNFSDTFEEIKKEITSHIPSKEIIATTIARKLEEKYLNKEGKYKKEFRENIKYQDQPIRRNSIILHKPEIRYRREEKEETPEIIHRSVMEYPEED